MLYLESFNSFQEDKLKPLTDKYGKSGYISVTTSKKLKELGIEPEQFKSLEKRVTQCTDMIKNDNLYLFDMLLLDLDDMLDAKGFGCERYDYGEQNGLPPIKPILKVNIGKNPLVFSSTDFEMHIAENPTETLFNIIKKTNDFRIDVVKKTIDDRKNRDHWYGWNYHKNSARDWGNLTKFKKQNVYENLTMKPVFKFTLDMHWGDIDPMVEYEDFNMTDGERESRKTQRRNVLNEVLKFLEEDTLTRYFHLIGYKNLKFRVTPDNFIWHSQTKPLYKVEVDF